MTSKTLLEIDFNLPIDLFVSYFSSLYYHLKQLDKPDKDQELKDEIQVIYNEHKGNYGYRRIHLELRNRGFVINHKRVQGLMKVLHLRARIRRTRKYSSHKGDGSALNCLWLAS